MVMFHLERDTVVTSLDKFGTGASSNLASQRQPFRPIKKRDDATSAAQQQQQEEEQQLLWLDRYWVRNRVKIAKGRTEMAALQVALDEAKQKRREVAMTPDGKDARQLVRGTVEYLEKATSGGDPAREERQKRLREQWSRVADELDNVVNGTSASVFSPRRHSLLMGGFHMFPRLRCRDLHPRRTPQRRLFRTGHAQDRSLPPHCNPHEERPQRKRDLVVRRARRPNREMVAHAGYEQSRDNARGGAERPCWTQDGCGLDVPVLREGGGGIDWSRRDSGALEGALSSVPLTSR